MAEKLTNSEIQAALAELDGWKQEGGKISRSFKFANFIQAFSFMTSTAFEAEKMNHHPEWSNVYNKVSVQLVTHEAGGITQLDIDLARKMNALSGEGRH
jgi:4a-hydroxytetrahydrobiopterin dehydratase